MPWIPNPNLIFRRLCAISDRSTTEVAVMSVPRITIVGAGLGGSLLSIFLARRGWAVDLYELLGGMRREPVEAGRSIELTLAERGLSALAELGRAEHVQKNICVPLRGRAVHSGTGTITY